MTSNLANRMLGQFFSDCRVRRGWTQANLAQKIGVSVSTLSKFERGKGSASARLIRDLSAEFHTDPSQIRRIFAYSTSLYVDTLFHGD